jgi:phosphopantetheinyl transferase
MSRGKQRVEAVFAFVAAVEFGPLKPEVANFLSEPECSYWAGLEHLRRQQSYLLGRLAAKLAIAEYLGEPCLKKIEIYPGVFGQPLVKYFSHDAPGVSISHCEGLASALAFPAGHPMAIDVEETDPVRVSTMKSQMTERELLWAQSGGAMENALCAVVWTAKESLSKVLRCGLMSPMEIMNLSELRPSASGMWEGLFQNFAQYKFVSWQGGSSVMSIVLPSS